MGGRGLSPWSAEIGPNQSTWGPGWLSPDLASTPAWSSGRGVGVVGGRGHDLRRWQWPRGVGAAVGVGVVESSGRRPPHYHANCCGLRVWTILSAGGVVDGQSWDHGGDGAGSVLWGHRRMRGSWGGRFLVCVVVVVAHQHYVVMWVASRGERGMDVVEKS